MDTIQLLAGLTAYLAVGRVIMRGLAGNSREAVFAILNLAGVFLFLFYGGNEHFVIRFAAYLVLVAALYFIVRLFSERRGLWPWVAFGAPLAALVAVRYVPGEDYVALGHLLGKTWRGPPKMIGISYLAFRCSRLVLEILNGVVQ